MSKRVIALLLAALALVVVAGCGSDDDEGSEETLTKVEFIEQGDKICEEAQESAEDEGFAFAEENGFDLEKNPTDEQLEETIAEVIVPVLNGQVEDIDALGAPQGDEETVEEMIVALEDGIAEVEDDPSVVLEGEPLKEATTIAEDYGFEVCGEE